MILTVKYRDKLKYCDKLNFNTGTHLLTMIIDASWEVNAYYNGVCMRRSLQVYKFTSLFPISQAYTNCKQHEKTNTCK